MGQAFLLLALIRKATVSRSNDIPVSDKSDHTMMRRPRRGLRVLAQQMQGAANRLGGECCDNLAASHNGLEGHDSGHLQIDSRRRDRKIGSNAGSRCFRDGSHSISECGRQDTTGGWCTLDEIGLLESGLSSGMVRMKRPLRCSWCHTRRFSNRRFEVSAREAVGARRHETGRV